MASLKNPKKRWTLFVCSQLCHKLSHATGLGKLLIAGHRNKLQFSHICHVKYSACQFQSTLKSGKSENQLKHIILVFHSRVFVSCIVIIVPFCFEHEVLQFVFNFCFEIILIKSQIGNYQIYFGQNFEGSHRMVSKNNF